MPTFVDGIGRPLSLAALLTRDEVPANGQVVAVFGSTGTKTGNGVTRFSQLPWDVIAGPVSRAPVDQAAADAAYALNPLGVYVPPGWGANWKAKRAVAQAGAGKATLAIAADSVGRGYHASNFGTKGWAALVRAGLQGANGSAGDGGSGYKGVQDNLTVMTALGVPSAARTAYAAITDLLVPSTGTWVSNGGFGLSNVSLNSTTAGSTLTFKPRGTTVSLYWVRNSGLGSLDWSIDGVAQASIACAGTAGIGKTSVSGLAAGAHTVVVTQNGTTNVFVCGVSGENATGVVVNNFSTYGAKASDFNNTDSFGGVAAWSGGKNYPADLNIHALTLNSATTGVAGDAWARDVHRYLQQVRNVANPTSDLMLLLQHVGNADNASPVYQDYVARARTLAEAYGAAVVDLWTLGRNSYAYWSAQGFWSADDGTGAAGSSAQHPSDAGFQAIANVLLPLLTA